MSWHRSGGSGAVMLLTQRDPLKRCDVGSRDGLTEDAATSSYGSCLSLAGDFNLQSLDWDLGLTGGEALILLSEWAEQSAVGALLTDLQRRQLSLQARHPQLVGHLGCGLHNPPEASSILATLI